MDPSNFRAGEEFFAGIEPQYIETHDRSNSIPTSGQDSASPDEILADYFDDLGLSRRSSLAESPRSEDAASQGASTHKPRSRRVSRDLSVEELRERNERRLLHNRISARQSRERKKQFVTTLEAQVETLQQDRAQLEATIAQLLWENQQLRAGAEAEQLQQLPLSAPATTGPLPLLKDEFAPQLSGMLVGADSLNAPSTTLQDMLQQEPNHRYAATAPPSAPSSPRVSLSELLRHHGLLSSPPDTIAPTLSGTVPPGAESHAAAAVPPQQQQQAAALPQQVPLQYAQYLPLASLPPPQQQQQQKQQASHTSGLVQQEQNMHPGARRSSMPSAFGGFH